MNNESKLLTEQGRLFGFRMPGVDPAQVLEIAKNSKYKKVSSSLWKPMVDLRIGSGQAIARVPAF